MLRSLTVSIFLILTNFTFSQGHSSANNKNTPDFLTKSSGWAETQLSKMTLDQKIGQLFMVAAYSGKDEDHFRELDQLISEYHIGGLIFFKGSPVRQGILTNRFQNNAATPLFIAIDGEWGLAMRLDSTVSYGRQMMLGALQDSSLIYKMGDQIGRACNELGIHINFAPVIDVNNNPKNPVINNRSFGEVKERVANYGIMYMKGLQRHNVLACGKHFPGHGDTDKDSHRDLPVILHDYKRLDSLELYPFKRLIDEKLASIMVAHLYIPELDKTPNQASTLSPKIVKGLLKDSLGFEGLVFTDALNMEGVAKFYDPGDVDVKALLAGNDVLLFPLNVPVAVNKIKDAIKKGQITEKEIDEKCLRILKAKEWAGLNNYHPIKTDSLIERLNPVEAEVLNRQIAKKSLTLIQNQNNALPLSDFEKKKTVYLNIGGTENNAFCTTMKMYTEFPMLQIPRSLSATEEKELLQGLKEFDRVIIGFHRTNNNPARNFGITAQMISIHEILSKRQEVISVIFGNPYVLDKFGDLTHTAAIVIGYEDNDYTNEAAAQLIFGGIIPEGKLPVTATQEFPAGTGLTFKEKNRLTHVIPEEIGVSSDVLYGIDQICMSSIQMNAFPGCQVVAIKDGNVFYNKAFGYHTYDKKRKVETGDLYDLASITKIAATTITIIKLQKEGIIDIDNTLGHYIPEIVDSTPYKNMVIREMLSHQAGLVAWIPFYTKTVVGGQPDMSIYSKDSSAATPHRVANGLFISADWEMKMLQRITVNRLGKKNYKYSDCGYYFLKYIIEKATGQQLEDYVAENFYRPMGLTTMGYHPLYRFNPGRITPTEQDTAFRDQLVWGDVHDPGAAMQGGVGGHAGLFSNALDLGTLMYMLIKNGSYGGKNYLDKDTIADFTKCQYCPKNRRGAGFDKPVRSLDGGPTCNKVSLSSFGHSGFTGTLAWADPEKGIVYVFLSNRVYPSAENWLIVSEGIRTRIQEVIYTACENRSEM